MELPATTNVVVGGILSGNVEVSSLVKRISIFNPESRRFLKKREKVPYMGHDGVLVSVRKGSVHFGVRGPSGVNSFGDADLQLFGRNIHFKISARKLLCMGVTSIEMAFEAMSYLCTQIEMAEENWERIRHLPEDVKIETVIWCWKNFKVNDAPPSTDKIDSKFAIIVRSLCRDARNVDEFLTLINNSLYCKKTCEPNLTVSDLVVHNSVLTYKIEGPINLLETAKKLLEGGKYGVMYNNWTQKSVRLVLKTDAGRNHKFKILPCGRVTQHSPSNFEETINVYEEFLEEMAKI